MRAGWRRDFAPHPVVWRRGTSESSKVAQRVERVACFMRSKAGDDPCKTGTAVFEISLIVIFGILGVTAVLLLARGSTLRRTARLDGTESHPSVRRSDFVHTFELLTRTRFTTRNRLELHRTGEAMWARLLEDLASAEDVITWHVTGHRAGRLADRLHDALCSRARAGVRVLFIRDGFGSFSIGEEEFDALRDAGVRVATFRPLRLTSLHDLQHRKPIRSVVIDGRIGWTGGFSVHDHWLAEPFTAASWRDTSVRMEGEVVDQLQAAFLAHWGEATGDLLLADEVLRAHRVQPGTHDAALLFAAPANGNTNADRFFVLSTAGAHERLWITNAGFVPDAGLCRLLALAVRRGVDVRVLTSRQHTGRRSTWYAARARYEEILEAGVRIFEYKTGLLSARTLVADGVWSCVGTIDPGNRSLSLNDEIGVVVRDAGFANEMEQIFIEDLSRSREITLDQLRSRPLHTRMAERAASIVAPIL